MNDFKKVSTLQERDFELQKQLNDINNASVKKFMKKAPDLPIVETKKKRPITGTPQSVADLALRDLAFQVQLDDIAEKAVGGKDIAPNKVNREITPEMIADFEDAQRVPVEFMGQQYKYVPSTADITLEELKLPHDIPNFPSVDAINNLRERDRQSLKDDYENIRSNIPIVANAKTEMERKFNETISKLKADKASLADAVAKKDIDALIIQQTMRYTSDIKRNKDELDKIRKDMGNIKGLLAGLDNHFDNLVSEFEDNQAEKERVDRINQSKIGAYIQDIQALNADLNIVRNIGETDEQFAQRLESLSQTLITEGEQDEAIKRKNFLRMKSNLGKLISDTAKAEATTKLLSPEEQFEYNKREPVVNKKFLEVYGFNNKRVSENEIADFIRTLISENPIALISSSKVSTKPTAPSTPIRAPSTPFPLASAVPILDTAGERLRKHIEDLGVEIPSGAVIKDVLDLYEQRSIEIPDDIALNLHNKKDRRKAKSINEALRTAPFGLGPAPPTPPTTTTGIGVKEYPKLVKFGKIYISADELYYKNILKIRNYNKKAIVGIPNAKVSEDLATILLKIIDGGKVSKANLNLLSNKERHIYDQICIMSGLHKTHDNTFDTTAQELKQQLDVVEGEIMAGNNNPELLKEVHKLLWTMNSVGLISGVVALKHFKEVKRNYF